MGAFFDYAIFPLFIPFILFWLLAARLLSFVSPFLMVPSIVLNRRLMWAAPFIPCIWRQRGFVKGNLLRLGFEASYCMNGAVQGGWHE